MGVVEKLKDKHFQKELQRIHDVAVYNQKMKLLQKKYDDELEAGELVDFMKLKEMNFETE